MAKYSVNSTEIIDDTGKIDWNKIKNAVVISGPQVIAVSATNCSTRGDISASVNSGTGAVTISLSASGGTAYVCQCQCVCMGA
mgnify:FL=1